MQLNATRSENSFYDAYGPRWVSTIYGASSQYKVLLELKPEFQADPASSVAACTSKPTRKSDPAGRAGLVEQDVGPQSGQPLRAALGCHGVVQSGAGRSLGGRIREH